MVQNAWEKIQALTAQLNRYRDEYYNSNAPSVSDAVYDRLYDELAALEKETGYDGRFPHTDSGLSGSQ